MKALENKGRNTTVKPTNGDAKPAVPDAPVVYDRDRDVARSKQSRLDESAKLIDANPESEFIILPVSSEEHSILEMGSVYREEGLEEWVKNWGLTAAHEVIDEIHVGLRDKKMKFVEVK